MAAAWRQLPSRIDRVAVSDSVYCLLFSRASCDLRTALTDHPRPKTRLLAIAAVGLLAACETPHPFAEDKPPADLLTFRDSIGVSVAPIEGDPATTADKLAPAVAKALQQLEIPATATSTGPANNVLYGRIASGMRISRGASKSPAAPRIASGGRGIPRLAL